MTEIQNVTDVMQHLEGLKAVIFDLDDTLYGEKEYVRSGYKEVSKQLPQVENAEQKLWNAFVSRKSAIDTVLLAEGIYTEALKQHCLETYRSHQPDIHFYDGVLPMLIELREQGHFLGIITDGRPEGQRAKISALGLEGLMDKIIITDELGGIQFRKPCTQSYILMKEFFNVNYTEMLYVGDNPQKDFIACETLGIKAVYFVNQDGLYSKTR